MKNDQHSTSYLDNTPYEKATFDYGKIHVTKNFMLPLECHVNITADNIELEETESQHICKIKQHGSNVLTVYHIDKSVLRVLKTLLEKA